MKAKKLLQNLRFKTRVIKNDQIYVDHIKSEIIPICEAYSPTLIELMVRQDIIEGTVKPIPLEKVFERKHGGLSM